MVEWIAEMFPEDTHDIEIRGNEITVKAKSNLERIYGHLEELK